eukprot:TRINITY_DN26206_c0_g1_i1.p1 TRINITY_DN26206_c0_g1~~TRINITY_DN26206_c0_g1_i1.p1  ORF type:complete len:156 (-),score=17.99 TRINITY_DN26206_c0_g1_i1:126-593(-)
MVQKVDPSQHSKERGEMEGRNEETRINIEKRRKRTKYKNLNKSNVPSLITFGYGMQTTSDGESLLRNGWYSVRWSPASLFTNAQIKYWQCHHTSGVRQAHTHARTPLAVADPSLKTTKKENWVRSGQRNKSLWSGVASKTHKRGGGGGGEGEDKT